MLDVADYAAPVRLGGTRDDAAGEAFDKGARLLGLSDPGGAALELVARHGDPERFPFPLVLRGQSGHDLSFSGLKTALLRCVRELGDGLAEARADVAASFQAAIVRQLVERAEGALDATGRASLAIVGGVAANGALREALGEACDASRRAPLPAPARAVRGQRGDDRRRGALRARATSPPTTSRSTPTRGARWRGRRAGCGLVYPRRVMTRRRRMRLFALSLAAALAGVVALPALGAPDPLQSALRTWDAVIHDGRAGQSLPLQVIVVLAAPPAVAIDSPEASKLAGSTQQLDLDAITSKGIWMKVKYRYVNALNAVSATVRPDQMAQLRAAPEVAGVYPVRKLYPAATVARHLAALGAAARPLTVAGADGAG